MAHWQIIDFILFPTPKQINGLGSKQIKNSSSANKRSATPTAKSQISKPAADPAVEVTPLGKGENKTKSVSRKHTPGKINIDV